jgi:hypothetical protein
VIKGRHGRFRVENKKRALLVAYEFEVFERDDGTHRVRLQRADGSFFDYDERDKSAIADWRTAAVWAVFMESDWNPYYYGLRWELDQEEYEVDEAVR